MSLLRLSGRSILAVTLARFGAGQCSQQRVSPKEFASIAANLEENPAKKENLTSLKTLVSMPNIMHRLAVVQFFRVCPFHHVGIYNSCHPSTSGALK